MSDSIVDAAHDAYVNCIAAAEAADAAYEKYIAADAALDAAAAALSTALADARDAKETVG